jgi:hypothetical protein
MPRGIVIFKSTLFCLMATTLFGCQNRTGKPRETASPQPLTTHSAKASPLPIDPADLDTVRRYAEAYEPKSLKDVRVPSPPYLDGDVLRALKGLADSHSREHEKYIVLIFLRIYRFHLEHFHQSYDLSEGYASQPDVNPLTAEFFRLISYQRHEADLSIVAADWVAKNPDLLEYPLIRREMVRIVKADKRIETALEKTTKELEERSRVQRKN